MTTFDYYKIPEGLFYPTASFNVAFRDRITNIQALVDSGATTSIFVGGVADALGIEIENGQETYLGGVGGRIRGFIHKLELVIAEKKLTVPVVFSREYTVSFNLLGRQGIFENFLITFDEKKKQTIFLKR